MLQWFERLIPHKDAFFRPFELHAAVMVKAAVALREVVAGGDQLKPRFQDILDLEHEADGIAREVLLGLRTTFITPFDRADIQSLITSMDDSVDQCKATAKGHHAVRDTHLVAIYALYDGVQKGRGRG